MFLHTKTHGGLSANPNTLFAGRVNKLRISIAEVSITAALRERCSLQININSQRSLLPPRCRGVEEEDGEKGIRERRRNWLLLQPQPQPHRCCSLKGALFPSLLPFSPQ